MKHQIYCGSDLSMNMTTLNTVKSITQLQSSIPYTYTKAHKIYNEVSIPRQTYIFAGGHTKEINQKLRQT